MSDHRMVRDDRGAEAIGHGAGRVWLCAQRSSQAQRRGRLMPESLAHPARMLPALAAHAISAYSAPGEVVLDPMCGIGTSLVEAVRAGRRALGVELEPRWVRVAEENLALARADGHIADARLVRGDARALPELLVPHVHAAQDAPSLVLTSPPYGSGVHGQVTNAGGPIVKYHHRYAATLTRANLAHSPARISTAMTAILRAAARVLRPGGHVVIVSRPWRHRGVLVDLPGQMTACAAEAGLVLTDRAVALLARLDDPHHDPDNVNRESRDDGDGGGDPEVEARLVTRASFFARHNLHRARAAGNPVYLIAHEDVYVLTRLPHQPAPHRPARHEPTGSDLPVGRERWR